MSHSGAHVHNGRTIFALNLDKNKVLDEMNAKKFIWSHWFRQGKAFATVDKRSYAQVLQRTSPAKLVEKQRTKKCNSKVHILVNRGPINKVVHATVTKSKHLGHQPSENGAKYSHNDTVSTHNRFQALENLHTDDIEVLLQSTSPSDIFINSATLSPSSTYVSTKAVQVGNSINKNHKNSSSSKTNRSGEAITVVSDVDKQETLPTVSNSEVNALANTDHHVSAACHSDSPA